MSELLSAIQKVKRKGAAGPDNTPPTFLKSLGPLALQELLSVFNSSFHLANCLWIWRIAIIIPLLKAGKLPSDLASFRPISLTSCVMKLLEHIIANQHYYIAESSNLFSRFPVGFCKGRSCENQILQLVQALDDGFQQRLMQGSVLTLLDFCKAYNIFWQENLLLCILDACISISFIRWLCSFLTDRRACLQLHNICSSSRHFNQSLPQGSTQGSTQGSKLSHGATIILILHKQPSREYFKWCCYFFVWRRCFYLDNYLHKKETLLQ